MEKYKCQRGKDNSCLTCIHGFESKNDTPCYGCQENRNCPLILSISYNLQRPMCEGCRWEKVNEH